MTVKLDALRVAPDFDASKYVAGANQVDAANDRVAASAVATGAALEQQSRKVSEAGNLTARLSHQYVEGYSQSVRFRKGLDNLSMALETGNASGRQAEDILLGMHRRLGMLANAEELAANGQHQLAAAVSSANAKLAANGNLANVASTAQMRLAKSSKMAAFQQRNLVYQLNDVAVSLASGMNPMMVFAQQGSQISTIYGPGEGGVGRALAETGKMAGRAAAKFWPLGLAIGAAAAVTAGLTYDINQASDANVSFGDTALAMWQVFASGAYQLAKPAIDQMSALLIELWETAKPPLKAYGNFIIGTYDLAYRDVVTIWSMLPAAMGDVSIQAANGVIGAVENMVNSSIRLLNWLIDQAREKTAGLVDFGSFDEKSLGRVENPNAGAARGLSSQLGQNQRDVSNRDYMGDLGGAITKRAISNANAPDEDEIDRMAKAADAYRDLVKASQGRIDQLGLEQEALGLTSYQANVLANTQDLLSKAANDNIELSREQRNELESLAVGMADAQMALDGVHLALENQSPWDAAAFQIANLNEMLARGAVSWDTYASAVGRVAEDMVGKYSSAATGIIGQGKKLTDALGLQGREQFEANKAFSIANAVVSGGEAVAKSYNWGTTLGGPVGGSIAAGLAAAATAAQIAAIASTSYNSKSATGSAGASGGAAPNASPSQAQEKRVVELNLRGVGSGVLTIEQFVETFKLALGDGHEVNINEMAG